MDQDSGAAGSRRGTEKGTCHGDDYGGAGSGARPPPPRPLRGPRAHLREPPPCRVFCLLSAPLGQPVARVLPAPWDSAVRAGPEGRRAGLRMLWEALLAVWPEPGEAHPHSCRELGGPAAAQADSVGRGALRTPSSPRKLRSTPAGQAPACSGRCGGGRRVWGPNGVLSPNPRPCDESHLDKGTLQRLRHQSGSGGEIIVGSPVAQTLRQVS